MSHPKLYTCPHCLQSTPQLGPSDVHGNPAFLVKGSNDYFCPICGNRETPPGGLLAEGGARNNVAGGAELSAAGKLLSIVCPTFAHTTTGTATITLDGLAEDLNDGHDGLLVTLTSGNTGHMTIPGTVVVPAGASSATVTVTGVATGTSVLTAAATGSTDKTVTASAS